MKYLSWLIVFLLLTGGVACSKEKSKPLIPLALEPGVTPQAIALTDQGTQAFKIHQFDEAKNYFSQAMTAAPLSGQAHYNYALSLYSLGNIEEARQHFLEAANLAPGDKVIWDSPALSPYGNPEATIKKAIPQQVPGRRSGPGGGGGGGGYP